MTPTKLLVGQILAVFVIVIAGLWLSTEWCAAKLAFQPRLGVPWLSVGGIWFYQPWKVFEWWYSYDAYAPALFNEAGGIAASSGIAGCAVAIIGSLWRARENRLVTTYGSSRWATKAEVEEAALFRAAGVFLGRLVASIFGMTGPSTSWPSPRPVRARASASLFPHCCPGPAARSSTTSKEKTGN